jgi:hypothetical protein
MKKLKKIIQTSTLALSLTLGASLMPQQNAQAGIIIGVASAGIAGPLIGLTLSATGFFWGIQHEDLNYFAAGLFILEQKANQADLAQILSDRYPTLDTYVIEELAALALQNAKNVSFNASGMKDISLTRQQAAPVLDLIAETDSELASLVEVELVE